ncbi:DRIM domain-containing protein [Mycena chlorophos]|uniref:DRIM domain-containing protein n=1 Tax=Mycena chlorophos TaxID=658473 RepID=A0A8H6THI8_MYCCL|nr:DRIM domain-containing protein [Mycena chlorophos]
MDVDEPRVNRFKHQSYTDSLKDVHVPSVLSQTPLEGDLQDHESHFYTSLDHWQQLNLAPSFIKFAQRARPLSASLPLLLHNWRELIELWVVALDESDDEASLAILDLLQKLTHDLRTTLNPAYLDPILPRLLGLLQRSKNISAEALTTLLTTFTAVFKFLLVPACSGEDNSLLEATWVQIRDMLPLCLPDVQRALAEVWGGVLRRLKSAARERALTLVSESVADESVDIQDAAAWSVVYACKSVSQTLHTCTLAVVAPLVEFHLSSSPSPSRTYTLLKRLITALIHHVRNADNFSVVGTLLVDKLVARAAGEPDSDSLRVLVDLVVIPTSVRNGSRLTRAHSNAIIAAFPSLFNVYLSAPAAPLRGSLLRLATAALTASPDANNAFWMGKGREVLDGLWNLSTAEATSFALSLTGSLADLSWAGWRAVGLPFILRVSSKILAAEDPSQFQLQARTLDLLAELWRTKKLAAGDGDVVWRNAVETWSVKRLGEMGRDVVKFDWDRAALLSNILTVSPIFSPTSNVCDTLISLCDALLSEPEVATAPSRPWIVGTCMRAIAKRPVSEWKILELVNWVGRGDNTLEIRPMYAALAPAVLSYSRPLRLAALRLLASTRPSDDRDVVKRCLAGEEVPLEVSGVRERVLRIGRVEAAVKDKQKEGDIGPDLCARWLIAQLKVNLRPLWSPAAGALAQMGQRFGDVVWALMFAELRSVHADPPPIPDGSLGDVDDTPVDEDDPREEERSWRDPSAHALREVVWQWLNPGHHVIVLMNAQRQKERFDLNSYETQLLFAFGESPALVQKHNRDLVPFFLNLTSSESKLPRHKLSGWLTLFSKLPNPKALHSTDALRDLYLATLSHPDRTLQTSALSCILTYKSPHIAPYETKLRALLDDTRWRDELSRLNFAEIQSHDRVEVVDVLIRLLFGLMLERKGRSRGADRRSAVLSALAGCTDGELGLLVDLMLKAFGETRDARRDTLFALQPIPDTVGGKQQLGFINLLGDVIRNLGTRLAAYWPALLGKTMDCIAHAQLRIAGKADDLREENEDDDEDDGENEDAVSPTKLLRSIRQLGLKRFADFFRCPVAFDFGPYMRVAFSSFISPRLAALDQENTQAPSALLELFNVWTLNPRHVTYLTQYDARLLPQVYACLVATNIKPVVVSKIFDIVQKILDTAAVDANVSDTVMKPHVSLLLDNLATLVERTKGSTTAVSSPLGQRQIGLLAAISQYSTSASQATTLLGLFSPLLLRPAKIVPEKVKVDLLDIIAAQMALIPDLEHPNSDIYCKTFELLSRLLQLLRSRSARLSLVATFRQLSNLNASLARVVDLLDSLNAYSARRVDEPDFDRRLTAFVSLNESLFALLSPAEWLPVVYNMLHTIQDPAELAIRTNSAFALRHFVDMVANGTPEYETMFLRVLYPGIKNGLRSKNELVRGELLGVLAYAVVKCSNLGSLQDMRVLLAGGDEEANFFNNIHHIQIHRRSRALRRLADQCDEGHLRSSTLAEILVPLVENYIADTAVVDHHLVTDAIATIGRMAKHLAWGAYYALVQKYLRLSRAKDASERVYIRTLVALLDNFHFSMEQSLPVAEADPEGDDDDEEGERDVVLPPVALQRAARIADAVNLRLLPSLLNHLEKRDDKTEDTSRIPIAVGIVRVALHLPAATREPQITRLLTVLSQVFKSRSQETRDLTRDTLARIAVSLGPSYLPLVFRELRTALLRGPQLHVLAYVTHSLLVHVSSDDNAQVFNNLDDCVADVAHISAEVVFGESAKDVLAEDFKTKMREARSSSSKALDSFGIIAKYITPQRLSTLLVPVRGIMHETASVKMMQLVDEVLRRVTTGLNANQHLLPAELLVLCHTLISQNAKFLSEAPSKRKAKPKGDAIVEMKRDVVQENNHYGSNSFRFIAFGLELFNTALRRSRFDFHNPEIIKRLDSMVVVIGNTLYTNASPVLISGLKAAAGIVKCPLPSLEKSVPVFVRQILEVVKQAGSTESEVVQVAFKSLATIFRDGPAVQVKEKDLVFLLELLTPDLEDPSRQASVFAILRGIVARKFVVAEIYQVMEKVAEVMVTSQSPQVQELCRSVLLQFLLDYPQGKGRLRNQMTFLAKNLSYEFESGRKSVLELLAAVLAKFEVTLLREYTDLLFVALAMVIANDDSAKCREMSAQLIKTLFVRMDDDDRLAILSHLRSWASQSAQSQLTRVAFQIYGFVVESTPEIPNVANVLEAVHASLRVSQREVLDAESGDMDMDLQTDWQVPYHALTLVSKLLRASPALTTQPNTVDWDLVVSHLLFPHSWVRTAACRLLGTLFAAVPPAAPNELSSPPLLAHSAKLRDVALKLCTQLKSPHLDDALGLQVVKNLFYIGKCFSAAPLDSKRESDEQSDDDDDEQEAATKNANPLPWLFSKLSYQLRSAHIARRNRSSGAANWGQHPMSVLRWFAAMAAHMDDAKLERFLVHILTPVYRITEDDTIRDSQMVELKSLAIELRDLVQTKVGPTKFSAVYNQIRQGVLGVQRERKATKVLQATVNPQAAARRKQQRNVIKKESRKRKGAVLAESKGKIKRRREE